MKITDRQKKIVAGVLIGAIVLTLGLGGYSLLLHRTSLPTTLQKVRVQAGWLLNGEFATVCSAITNGYYRDQGLDVELIPGGPSGSNFIVATNALAQDPSIDIAIDGDVIPLLRGVAQKTPSKRMQLKAFATFWSDNPYGFFVRKDSGITSIADFVKPLANGTKPRLGLTSDAVVQYAIAKDLGVSVNDLNIVTTGFDATPFISRQVDILGGYWTTQAYELEKAKIDYNFISASTIPGFSQPSMIAIASNKTITERPEMLEKWLTATAQGSKAVKADPAKAAEAILDPRCGGSSFNKQQEEWLIRKSLPLFTTPYGKIDVSQIDNFAKSYYAINQIPRVPAASEYLTTTILDNTH